MTEYEHPEEECVLCEAGEPMEHNLEPRPKPTERWHIVLTDYGSLSGEIEWDSRTIADAAWNINQAWGRWHELPGSDGVVLLADSLIARVYDTTKDTDAPAYELTPHEKRGTIVRRRPRY